MKKPKFIKPLSGILCVLILAVVVLVALYLDSLLPDPIFGIFRPMPTPDENTSTTHPGYYPLEPPDDLPASVVIPTEKDPQTGKECISFPCQVPGYDLVIHRLAPYDGLFVEDGSNATVKKVAMLMVSNEGDYPIEYAQISVQCGDQTLLFDISALPVGEKLVVQEKTGQILVDDVAQRASATVVRRADLDMSTDQVEVTDNGNNTLTIRNLTKETIPTVRVFYKYYMKDEDVFVGGIAFTVRVTRLAAESAVTLQPSHYTSETGRVVMVLTYDTEV